MSAKTPLHFPSLIVLLTVKGFLHLWAVTNGYGLHRDEFLYLAEGAHPGWGYMEGPPMIGWLATISTSLLGSSVWAAKLPALMIGLLSIYLLLQCVREFGGNRYAQLLAGAAWVLSPVYLGSNNLFQPVSFNQFCWLLLGWAFIRLIRYHQLRDYLLLGLIIGIGLLTKYSFIFYLFAILVGLLSTPQRKYLINRKTGYTVAIALLLILPNAFWQISNNFPVMRHMQELAATQLVNVTPLNFLLPQILFHALGILFWLPGLLFLVGLIGRQHTDFQQFRFLGYAYLITLILLLLLSGKPYYSYGAYSILIAAGGVYWADKLGERSIWLAIPLVANFLLIPFGLPILPVNEMQRFSTVASERFGFRAPLRWEDGSYRSLSQDYADMHGWEEMVSKVAGFYHKLSPEEQAKCMIYAGNYGQAGALTFYQKKYKLPSVNCFAASYLLWENGEEQFIHQIAVEDAPDPVSPYFNINQLIDSSQTKYAREQQFIYFRSEPTEDLAPVWRNIINSLKEEQLGK